MIRLPEKYARAIVSEEPHPLLDAAIAEIRRQLAPVPKSSAVKKTEKKRREKGAETKDIRAAVMERAGGICEVCCTPFASCDPAELDHFFPKGRTPQSERTTWAIHRTCHRQKTLNHPSAAWWLDRFIYHCRKRGFTAEAEQAQRRLDAIRIQERA